LSGKVLAKKDRGELEIEVVGNNSMGPHVTGTVTVQLP